MVNKEDYYLYENTENIYDSCQENMYTFDLQQFVDTSSSTIAGGSYSTTVIGGASSGSTVAPVYLPDPNTGVYTVMQRDIVRDEWKITLMLNSSGTAIFSDTCQAYIAVINAAKAAANNIPTLASGT